MKFNRIFGVSLAIMSLLVEPTYSGTANGPAFTPVDFVKNKQAEGSNFKFSKLLNRVKMV